MHESELILTLTGSLGAALILGFVTHRIGLSLSVASTVVLTRILVENDHVHTAIGRIAIGWLVVEDIFTVLVLVLLPAIFSGPGTNTGVLAALVLALLKIALLIVLAFVL